MKAIINRVRYFLFPSMVIFILWLALIIFISKGDLHMGINEMHHPWLDWLFKFSTWLGDGWMIFLVSILLFFIKYRYAVIFLVSTLVTTIIIQVLKKLVFPEVMRPKVFFEGIYELYLVPGVDVHSFHSFPSGHAATAFGIFVMLSLVTPQRSLQFLWFIMATLTAFSRVYLSQHFMIDILAGSVTGVVITILTYYYFSTFVPKRLEGSLTNILLKK